jgi:predicted ATP-dependent protease
MSIKILEKKVKLVNPKISKRQHKGYVYNVTTETGNLFVEDILVHNSGGLGTPPHLRVECLAEDSLVLLSDGMLVEVKDLLSLSDVLSTQKVGEAFVHHVSGLNLIGFDNFKTKEAPLYRIIERPFEGEMYEVTTRFGEKILVTGNHPLAVFTKTGIDYIPAEKLSENESLIKPKELLLTERTPALPEINLAQARNAVHLTLTEVNENFCYWLGGMLSEGDFTSFQYPNSNKSLCDEMVNCFERATGFKAGVYERKDGCYFASFNRKEVSELTGLLGLNGKGAKQKEIPSGFTSLPKKLSVELIAGLFDGDGSIGKDGEICYSSASKKLAFQVKTLLLQFGIQSSLSKKKQTWNVKKESELYRVRVLDRVAVENFLNLIPLKRKELKENCVKYLNKTSFSKTMKRKTIPSLFNSLDQVRKDLFMIQDEVISQRQFKNYSKSDVSFEKLELIVGNLEKRIDELRMFSLEVASADWQELKEIAKNLHLGTRKVRTLSGKDFRWAYRTNAKTLPFFQKFFSSLCSEAINNAQSTLDFLKKVVGGNFAFDQIVSIEKKNYVGKVYDLTTETGNFISQNLLIKNCGMIHRASGGVLFIDEIATLSRKSQQELLSAMQDKKYAITGQSENSSGAMTRSDPVPCDFVLVAAGNYPDLDKVHPALRSRIRGYGYEVYMNNDMPDNEENQFKIAQFIAQEVKKDGKIPHFSKEATEEIIFEARRRAGRKGKLTLKLRDLGGLVRAAGDIAREKQNLIVQRQDVIEAKVSARTLEAQMVDKAIETKKDYEVYLTKGSVVGRVNGLAVFGDGSAGSIIPIEAAVSPPSSKNTSKVIATGKLGEIAKEAVENVSVIFKKISEDKFAKDIHIQFLQTYEGVEGDSASVSIATAVISAIEKIPIKQNIAMTGSLSVRGEVLPVGGVTSKVSAAVKAGFSEVIVPKSNLADIVLSKEELVKIKILPVATLVDVLEIALENNKDKKRLIAQLKKIIGFSKEQNNILKKIVSKVKV